MKRRVLYAASCRRGRYACCHRAGTRAATGPVRVLPPGPERVLAPGRAGQDEDMVNLAAAAAVGGRDKYLAVISTLRADQTIQTSLVNAGRMADPESGDDVIAFVTNGRAKLTNLRARPQVTVTFRAGWQWAAIEGRARIIGDDDPAPGFDAERLRLLRREVFTAAGGTHDDWDEYDRVMAAERRAVVLVTPARVYGTIQTGT